MRVPLRSPIGYPLKATLLPFLPDRQANASYPKTEKKQLLNPPIGWAAGIFAAPHLILNHIGYFWNFWCGSPSSLSVVQKGGEAATEL